MKILLSAAILLCYTSRFEKPGAVVINKTSSGTIYNMPEDNIAVLVPEINAVEKMPGGDAYVQAPNSNMPNPLDPDDPKKKKKKK